MTTREGLATRRDLAVNALVLGAAAFVWFGWAQEGPPPGWSVFLAMGSGLGLLLALVSVVAMRRLKDGSAMSTRAGRRAYGITVGIELAVAVAGVVVLSLTGNPDYVSPWILAVVGLHFIPMARLFGIRLLAAAGIVLTVVAIAAAVVGALTAILPSAIAGGAGGLVLLGFGLASLHRAWRP
nr:DUF6609 family protein [Propionicimonas sp.]